MKLQKLWCNNRSKCRKFVIITIFIIILIVLSVLIYLILKKTSKDVCNTKKCLDLSTDILRSIDFSIEPCKNFYDFACGNYEKRYKNSKNDHIVIASVLGKFLINTMDILAGNGNEKVYRNSRLTELSSKIYKSCIKNVTNDHYYDRKLISYINEFGGLPMIEGDKWNEKNWSWINMIRQLRHYGFEYSFLFNLNVWVTGKRYQKRILRIAVPIIYIQNDKDFMYSVLVRTIKDIYKVDETIFMKELKDAIDFHMKLSQIAFIPDIKRTITFGQLKQKVSNINWEYLIKIIINEDFQIDNSQMILVYNLNYLKLLANLLKSTSKRIIANYMVYRTILKSLVIINMLIKKENRHIECIEFLLEKIPIGVMAAYTTKYEDLEKRNEAIKMFEDIMHEFENTLKTSNWLSENLKIKLIKKLNKIELVFGLAFGTKPFNETYFDNFYQNINVHENDMFTTILNIHKSKEDFNYRQLIKPTDNFIFDQISISLAFYIPLLNNVFFAPYATNEEIIFDIEYPQSINYGRLGFMYMHEVAHGFAKDYHNHDVYGELIEWDDKSFETFKNKILCIYYQYENYTEPQTNLLLNGVLTLEENFADNQGIESTYKAYSKWLKTNKDKKLLGLKYDSKQLYWISYAQQWCASMTNATILGRLYADSHSLPRFRVVGPLQNQKAFSDDFHCKIGSPMNPRKKCQTY